MSCVSSHLPCGKAGGEEKYRKKFVHIWGKFCNNCDIGLRVRPLSMLGPARRVGRRNPILPAECQCVRRGPPSVELRKAKDFERDSDRPRTWPRPSIALAITDWSHDGWMITNLLRSRDYPSDPDANLRYHDSSIKTVPTKGRKLHSLFVHLRQSRASS